MIIINGTLTPIRLTEMTQDANGDPIKSTETPGVETECNIKLKTDRKFNYENGETKISSYEILIEIKDFTDTRIRLKSNRNQTIGDYEVLSIEYLEIAQCVKITV